LIELCDVNEFVMSRSGTQEEESISNVPDSKSGNELLLRFFESDWFNAPVRPIFDEVLMIVMCDIFSKIY